MTTLIKNGYVINPDNDFEGISDIFIENGVIKEVGENINFPADEVIDATGKKVIPGLVDMHVHLRDPGFIHKEDILTGCEAAAAGGVTSLLCMPNTKPVIDNKDVIDYINNKAQSAKAKVYITGAISKDLSGDKLNDFESFKNEGVVAVSDDGRPVKNARLMTEALTKAKEHGLLVTSHCEDLDIIDGGIINDGEVSKKLGVKGMNRSSEDYITAREIILAENNDCRVHIAHVSTHLSVQLVREAKLRGAKVTCETCPHYFIFDETKALTLDADYRMNPPLREEKDVKAVLKGIKDKTIDCIVTDHAPHTPEEKKDFFKAPNGVIGMETSFAACNTYLVKAGHISLLELVKLMSYNPAKILGIKAGTLNVGEKADIAIVDADLSWMVDPKRLKSRAENCIFKGMALKGKVIRTLLNGKNGL